MQELQRQRLAGCLAELQGALGVVEQASAVYVWIGLLPMYAHQKGYCLLNHHTTESDRVKQPHQCPSTITHNPIPKQYTDGSAGGGQQQGSSITQHEKFAATKMVYYALCRLNGLLLGSVSKEALLPLEGPLVQVCVCCLFGGWVR